MHILHLKLKEKLLIQEIENLERMRGQYGENSELNSLIVNARSELAEVQEQLTESSKRELMR